MKRYDYDECAGGMDEFDDGEFVRYDDAMAEIEKLRADIHHAEVDALHAELDRLVGMMGEKK